MSSPVVANQGVPPRPPTPAGPRATRRRPATLAIVVVAALLLSACGANKSSEASTPPGSGGTSITGGTLRIAMSAGNIPFPSTPPNEGYEGYRFVGNNLYDGLTRFDLAQSDHLPEPGPGLAESWTISDDKLTWTFKLRTGVTFHDGTPFDADAVIFQFDRQKKKDFEFYDSVNAPRYSQYFRFMQSYEKVDASTVKIVTTQPYGWLIYDLAHIYYPSPAVVKKFGNKEYNAHASGTGPFTMAKYVDGEVMELVANEKYYKGRPKLDKIILRPQPEAASRLAALQSGEVDWAEVPSPDALDQLKGDGYQVFLGKHPGAIMPRFNQFRPPFKDNPKLRMALNYALDREGTTALLNNAGAPAKQYVYEGHPHYTKEHPGYSYDVAKAKSLLADAGFGPGQLKIKMAYTTGGSGNMYPGVMMEKLQTDFKAIGVDVTLAPMEWNTLITVGLDGLDKPQWSDIDILWASPAAGMIPSGYLNTFLCTRGGGDILSAVGTCNKPGDEAYLQAATKFTPAEWNPLIQKMHLESLKAADYLFWMQDLNLRVMSPKVKGYVQPQSWWVDFTTIAVEKE